MTDFGIFGSNKTHNQNKKNTGYNNALYEGVNFSTTLGLNFSTVVGANFSTTGGFNVPFTLGGKIELISPWSIKWTRGLLCEDGVAAGGGVSSGSTDLLPGFDWNGYDYDFKNCQTQIKWNTGKVYNYSEKPSVDIPKQKATQVTPLSEVFAEQKDETLGTRNIVAESESVKVQDSEMKYGNIMTTVDQSYELSVQKDDCGLFMGSGGVVIATKTLVEIDGSDVKITCTEGKCTISGKTVCLE